MADSRKRKTFSPGVGTVRLPGLQRALLRVICLPAELFQQPERFKSQAVSLESTAQGFQKQHTTPSFSYTHSLWAQRRGFLLWRVPQAPGSVPAWGAGGGTRKVCVSPHQGAAPPSPHPSKTSDSHTLTSSQGRRLPRRCTPFFTFSLRLQLRRRLGKEIWERQDNSQHVQAQRSWTQVFSAASSLKASGTWVPGNRRPAIQHNSS